MTHEPKFGCRWQVLKEHQEEDPPIMCEDDSGPWVLHEHFVQLEQQLTHAQQRVARLEEALQTLLQHKDIGHPIIELAKKRARQAIMEQG